MTAKTKNTVVHKLDVTSMDITEILGALHKTIQGFRDDGWHFAASTPVDWLLEDGKTKQYILCTFCK
jgi:hypothetical protein